MFGRRDRCLLVLYQVAGVPYQSLAALTVIDITFSGGGAIVTTAAGAWMVAPDDDRVVCGCSVAPCAGGRDDQAQPSAPRPGRGKGDAGHRPVTASVPLTRGLSPKALGAPLLPPIDQWGYVPFPLQRLTPHSLSRRVRDLLAGDLRARRHLPVDLDQDAVPVMPAPVRVVQWAVYRRDDAQWAWAKRRTDLDEIAGVAGVLDQIDARARQFEQRTAALVAAEWPTCDIRGRMADM